MTPYDIEQAGKEAFHRGEAAWGCPYSFDRSEFWETKDYAGFNSVRWKLDAWMKGWIEARRAEVAARTPTRSSGDQIKCTPST